MSFTINGIIAFVITSSGRGLSASIVTAPSCNWITPMFGLSLFRTAIFLGMFLLLHDSNDYTANTR